MTRARTLALALALLTTSATAYPPESTFMRDFDWTMQSIHSSEDWQDPRGFIPAYGDSILHRWSLAPIHPSMVQRGVSGTTLPAICRDVTHYVNAPKNALAVLLEGGSNDTRNIIAGKWTLEDSAAAQACIAKAISTRLVWLAIPEIFDHGFFPNGTRKENTSKTIPQQNALATQLNANAAKLCKARPRCVFVRWPLTAEHTLDGLHPSPVGYTEEVPIIQKEGFQVVGAMP